MSPQIGHGLWQMNPAAPVWEKTSCAQEQMAEQPCGRQLPRDGRKRVPAMLPKLHKEHTWASLELLDLCPSLASWPCLPGCQGKQAGSMFLNASCQKNIKTCHDTLEKSLQLSEQDHSEEGSVVFPLIYQGIVSTFGWHNEYEGTFKTIKMSVLQWIKWYNYNGYKILISYFAIA